MNNDKKKKFLIYTAYIAVITALVFILIKFCLAFLLPFIIGAVIAILLQPLALKISKKIKIKKGTVALCLVIGFYVFLIALLFMAGNRIYAFAISSTAKIPDFITAITHFAEKISKSAREMAGNVSGDYSSFLITAFNNVIQDAAIKVSGVFSAFLTDFAAAVPVIVFSIFAAILTGCYIAKDFDKIKQTVTDILKPQQLETIDKIRRITMSNTGKLIRGYTLLSLIAFIVLFLGMLILGVTSPFKKAFFIALVDVLPVFGCGTVLIPWAIISIFTENFTRAIGLAILYAAVTVVRNICEPKIIGKQVGLHPLATLASMFLGLKILGISGIIILPFITTVAYRYFAEKVTEENLSA
ncbi:MAG: sporulation integral membrane protein YtvI [Ruminococcaceae bacterium]|nr:sporulation integral membrane protein YtvI [Oscillospiraceae bacterium]